MVDWISTFISWFGTFINFLSNNLIIEPGISLLSLIVCCSVITMVISTLISRGHE